MTILTGMRSEASMAQVLKGSNHARLQSLTARFLSDLERSIQRLRSRAMSLLQVNPYFAGIAAQLNGSPYALRYRVVGETNVLREALAV